MLRPVSWRDLPTVFQYRHQGVFLYGAQVATRGNSLLPASLLHHLKPASHSCMWICKDPATGVHIVGQSLHSPDTKFARLSFLAPRTALHAPGSQLLIDQLARLTGQQNSFYLLAEVEASSKIFEVLRLSGFTAYAQQRIWKISKKIPATPTKFSWKIAQSGDRLGIQALYRHVTPEKIQHFEDRNIASYKGLVYIHRSDVLGFAHVHYGSQGIWVQPYIQRNTLNAEEIILSLFNSIPERRSRPLHICVRSYQANIEPVLQSLAAIPGPQQTNMVKQLAVKTKIRNLITLPNINGQPEISMPFSLPGHKFQSTPRKIENPNDMKRESVYGASANH
ncbi:MAG: hypothetical protein IZT55_04850 [Anaerolineae bacterium]|nr:hypothetical protein [Anaerolineae bacterium]